MRRGMLAGGIHETRVTAGGSVGHVGQHGTLARWICKRDESCLVLGYAEGEGQRRDETEISLGEGMRKVRYYV